MVAEMFNATATINCLRIGGEPSNCYDFSSIKTNGFLIGAVLLFFTKQAKKSVGSSICSLIRHYSIVENHSRI